LKTTEPYSPWQNAAEAAIRELKRGVARKMAKSKAPRQLWDDCLELELLIWSNTAHRIYELRGQVPKTLVLGEMSDILPFCKLEWYQWVKFCNTQTPFPNDKEVLGQYLGPSFDVGPAMCVKILKSNGHIVHWSTYQALDNNEMGTCVEVEAMELFDWLIVEQFGHNQQAVLTTSQWTM
jgi:hypothetical protein